jgi:hypothetical protein
MPLDHPSLAQTFSSTSREAIRPTIEILVLLCLRVVATSSRAWPSEARRVRACVFLYFSSSPHTCKCIENTHYLNRLPSTSISNVGTKEGMPIMINCKNQNILASSNLKSRSCYFKTMFKTYMYAEEGVFFYNQAQSCSKSSTMLKE